MADLWTPFKPVTSGAGGTIPNGLPNEYAAESFQYRKVLGGFFSFGSLDLGAGGGGGTLSGKFKIRLRESQELASKTLFEQEVQVRISVVVQAFFGGIGLFFWSPMDNADAYQKITTICDGQVVPIGANGQPEGWRFVDTATPTIYSEQGDVRAGDFDDPSDDLTATGTFTADGGYIDATFQSPRYRCHIPVGAVLEIEYDQWQFHALREPTYTFSFREGAPFSALLDWTAGFRMAEPMRAGVFLGHRYTRGGAAFGPQHVRSMVADISEPHIAKTADNVLYLLAKEGTRGRLWYSEDDGTTLHKMTRRTKVGGEEDVTVFGDGYTMLDLKATPDGQLVALGQKDNVLYLTSDSDGWKMVRTVGPVRNGAVYRLGIGRDGSMVVGSPGHEWIVEGDGKPYERPAPAGPGGGA